VITIPLPRRHRRTEGGTDDWPQQNIAHGFSLRMDEKCVNTGSSYGKILIIFHKLRLWQKPIRSTRQYEFLFAGAPTVYRAGHVRSIIRLFTSMCNCHVDKNGVRCVHM